MKDKYTELQKELVRSLTERLLDFEYTLGKRNYFYEDVEVDKHIFFILSDHLWCKTEYAKKISELVESKQEANVFDRIVRERVYDELYKASGGLT